MLDAPIEDHERESEPSISAPRAAAAIAAIFLALGGLAALYNSLHWHHLDPDSIAYMRIAEYCARGELRLAVSGYWGPLLSWLMVPGIWAFGATPDGVLAAARGVMVLSSVVFLGGAAALFARSAMPPAERIIGAALVAIAAVGWSKYIFADLLMAGLFLYGYSQLISDGWVARRRSAAAAGAAFALAYLAKPVAFPAAIGLILLVAGLATWTGAAGRGAAQRAAAVTLLAFAAVAGPWVAVLSVKYGRPVFSTGGPLAHAIAGPADAERFHPTFVTFHVPEPGRLTSWEDPSALTYNDWSPFASAAYFRYQANLAFQNFGFVMRAVSSFEIIPLGVFCVLAGFLVHSPWSANMRRQRWRWALLPLACALGLYLPLFAGAPRYYWVALPLTIAASLRALATLAADNRGALLAGRLLVILSFGATAAGEAIGGFKRPAWETTSFSKDLAERLAAAGVRGPIAGNWSPNNAFYVAYWLGEPYYGHEPRADAARCKASGARIVIVDRANAALAVQLDRDPAFKCLDAALFAPGEPPAPVRVYESIGR